MFNKKIKKEVDFVLFRPPPSGRERLYIGRVGWSGERRMYRFSSIELAERRAKELKEVLCKYGLEKDQEAMWSVGVRNVDDV